MDKGRFLDRPKRTTTCSFHFVINVTKCMISLYEHIFVISYKSFCKKNTDEFVSFSNIYIEF